MTREEAKQIFRDYKDFKDSKWTYSEITANLDKIYDSIESEMNDGPRKIVMRNNKGIQIKKKIYESKKNFEKYAPETINRWSRFFEVEIYSIIRDNWTRIGTVPKQIKE